MTEEPKQRTPRRGTGPLMDLYVEVDTIGLAMKHSLQEAHAPAGTVEAVSLVVDQIKGAIRERMAQ